MPFHKRFPCLGVIEGLFQPSMSGSDDRPLPQIWNVQEFLLHQVRNNETIFSIHTERLKTIMIRETLASKLYSRVCCFVLFFVTASASFNGFYEKWHFRDYNALSIGAPQTESKFPHVEIEWMLDGTAAKPYVYRQLVPAAANWIDRITPSSIKIGLYNLRPHGYGDNDTLPVVLFDSPIARSQTYFFRYLVVYVVTFLFTLLAVYAMYLVCMALKIHQAAAVLAPVVVILLFPYVQSIGGYFYDFLELAFLALAVWIALTFDWWWIIPVAALGTWNKESFLLAIPALYPIIRQRSSRLGSLLGTGILGLVCLAVYYPIRLRFAQNPGGTTESHLAEQWDFFAHPGHLIYRHSIFEKTYGLLLPPVFTVLPLALLLWTVWRGWRHMPLAVRRHGLIAAAINIPLYVLFCWPGELRDFSLLFIFFLLALAYNLSEWLGCSTQLSAPPVRGESHRGRELRGLA